MPSGSLQCTLCFDLRWMVFGETDSFPRMRATAKISFMHSGWLLVYHSQKVLQLNEFQSRTALVESQQIQVIARLTTVLLNEHAKDRGFSAQICSFKPKKPDM